MRYSEQPLRKQYKETLKNTVNQDAILKVLNALLGILHIRWLNVYKSIQSFREKFWTGTYLTVGWI